MKAIATAAACLVLLAPQSRAEPPCREIEIAVDGDYEFTQSLFGGDSQAAENYIADLIGEISAIFEAELDVRLVLTFTRAWDDPADPYTTTDPQTLLQEFRAHWETSMGDVPRDAAILLSGKTLQGAVREMQFVDSLCGGSAYGLLSELNGSFPMPLMGLTPGNEDPLRITRTIARFIGARSLRSLGSDPCWPSCGEVGTIFSSCERCTGGTGNIVLEFDPVNTDAMLAFLEGAICATGCACPPDLNGDGTADTQDVLAFLNAWVSGEDQADWNGDLTIDTRDVTAFLNDWAAGC